MKDDTASMEAFGAKIALFPSTVTELQKSLLAHAGSLVAAQEQTLQDEIERKTVKFGKDSDRVKAAAARVAMEKTVRAQLRAQAQRAEIKTPEPQAEHMILHGRLTDSGGLGLTGLVVNGIGLLSQKVLCRSAADRYGYFKLDVRSPPDRLKPTAEAGANKSSADRERVRFTLQVMNRDQAVLYRDEQAHTLEPGSVVYREIIIGDAPE